jgi:hypothetical protein
MFPSAHMIPINELLICQQNLAGNFHSLPLEEMVMEVAFSVCSSTETPQDDLLLLGLEV